MKRIWSKSILACSSVIAATLFNNEIVTKWESNWDFMSKLYSSENSNNDICHQIILVRHGQYVHAKEFAEKKLTELGRQQAIMTGQKIKQMNIKFDNVVCSTMTRAMETANLILSEIGDYPIKSDPILEEGPPYRTEPVTRSYSEQSRDLFVHSARIEAAFRKFVHRQYPPPRDRDRAPACDSHSLIVCHGNVIRYFVCRALQFPPEAWLRLSLDHASITRLSVFGDGRVVLDTYNDASHMPVACVTR